MVVAFLSGGAYDSVWDSVKPMTGNYLFSYFQYLDFVGYVCMLNYCFSNNDEICADNYNYSRFKLTDKCRSEKWEVYLYGYSRFKLKGQCRSKKWEVFLYSDSRFKLTDSVAVRSGRCICTATFLHGGPWSCGSVAQGCASALVFTLFGNGSHHL